MKKLIAATLLTLATTGAIADTIWLNIPSHWNDRLGEQIPAVSYPTADRDTCADAIVTYAKMEYVYYIGCDVMPLKDAANLRRLKR